MKKRILSFVLVMMLLVGMLPTAAFADEPTSGQCGENAYWSFDESTSTLTIGGSGNMYDYYSASGGYSPTPWYNYVEKIKYASISDSITSIGWSAFYGCSGITSIDIPNSITSIRDYAFYGCSGLISITIPDGVTSIDNNVFSGCSGLTSIDIPDSVTSIGRYAFDGCSDLTGITIPDSVTFISIGAFYKCSSLTSITIPDSVTSIEDIVFRYCSSLTSIDLPDSVPSIGWYAFDGCSDLTSITIPDSVTSISFSAFDGCSSLTDVYYAGTEDQWNKIVIGDYNDYLLNATIHFNSTIPEEPKDPETPENPDDPKNPETPGNPDEPETPEIEIKDTSKIFTDVEKGSWYQKYVDYTYTYGIFKGTGAATFSPNDNITRAEFVQVLANLEGVDTSNKNVTTKFTDVPSGQWFTAAVKWASENGVVNGVGDGKFDPDANVTREQMCVMFVNYAKFKGMTLKNVESKSTFADDAKISKWAKAAVYTCQQADIVNGKGANTFDPQGTGTRAEASVLFTKFHKDYLKK